MKLPAREALVIYWMGDEVPGLAIYALFGRGASAGVGFPHEAWPQRVETQEFLLHNTHWEVRLWEFQVLDWPSDDAWLSLVRRTLKHFVDAGAPVAWIGDGVTFADPPQLFDPPYMTEGVLAALTRAGQFWCPLDPDKPLAALTDEQLLELRRASAGLSDAE